MASQPQLYQYVKEDAPELSVSGQTVTLPVRNFEITTLRIQR